MLVTIIFRLQNSNPRSRGGWQMLAAKSIGFLDSAATDVVVLFLFLLLLHGPMPLDSRGKNRCPTSEIHIIDT